MITLKVERIAGKIDRFRICNMGVSLIAVSFQYENCKYINFYIPQQ